MRRFVSLGAVLSMVSVAAVGLAGVRARAASSDDKVDKDERHVQVIQLGGGARLGVMLDDVHADDLSRLKLSEERGAVVKEVTKGSAAEKAGLQSGDVIVSYQGERITSVAQLRRLVRETPPGRRVAIEASRAGALQRLTATLEDTKGGGDMAYFDDSFHFDVPVPPIPPMPPMPPMSDLLEQGARGNQFFFRDRSIEGRPGRLGLSFQELSGQLARYFKVEDGALLVTRVDDDGPAAQAGLRAGDVITKVGDNPVTDGDVLMHTLADVPAGEDVAITVQREGRSMDVKVRPRGEKRTRGPHPTT
jgi:serine protease Do